MVNEVIERYGDRATQTIQTNGTIDRLDEFSTLKPLRFNVSIDGQREAHEWHRGEKTYDRTLAFCRRVLEAGCQELAIRVLLTRDNIHGLDELHAELVARIGPRFSLCPLMPFNNQAIRAARPHTLTVVRGDIDDSRVLSETETRAIMAARYGGRYELDEDAPAVVNYLSLTTYGVFSCCNAVVKLGEVDTDVAVLKDRLARSEKECRDCALFPCI